MATPVAARSLSSPVTAGLLLVAGTAADAAAVTVTVGGVTYRADDAAPAAGATVTSVGGTAPKNLTIPATVTIARRHLTPSPRSPPTPPGSSTSPR